MWQCFELFLARCSGTVFGSRWRFFGLVFATKAATGGRRFAFESPNLVSVLHRPFSVGDSLSRFGFRPVHVTCLGGRKTGTGFRDVFAIPVPRWSRRRFGIKSPNPSAGVRAMPSSYFIRSSKVSAKRKPPATATGFSAPSRRRGIGKTSFSRTTSTRL